MTQQEARALVRKECRKRGRKYGAGNGAAIRAMREEMTWLHEHPSQARRIGTATFSTRIGIAGMGGAYMNFRRAPHGDPALRYD